MFDFSSLPKVALWLIRGISIGIAGLLAGLITAILWARHGPDGFAFQANEKGDIGLMVVLIIVALLLARVTGRELKRMLKD